MKVIPVDYKEHRFYIQVDDDDYPNLMKYKWHWRWKDKVEDGYAVTRIGRSNYSMHRMVMGVMHKQEILVDHINGNRRDNRKSNLRLANRFQNQQNRKTNEGKELPKGIRTTSTGKFNVRVQAYGQVVNVGTFLTLEKAVAERNRIAKKLHKEFYNAAYIEDENREDTTV